MNRDDIRKKAHRARSQPSAYRNLKIMAVAIFLVMSLGATFFYLGTKPGGFLENVSMTETVSTWMQRVSPTKTAVAKEKKSKLATTVAKSTSEAQIHFEFYNTLPNLQMKASVETEDTTSNLPMTSPNKSDIALIHAKTEPTKTLAVTQPIHPEVKNEFAKKMAALVVSDPEELAQELSRHIKQTKYIVQLGSFETAQAAQHFSNSLQEKGFAASVMPGTLSGKKVFRVQLGPFNKDQAKMAQQKLQNRNIPGLIRPVRL